MPWIGCGEYQGGRQACDPLGRNAVLRGLRLPGWWILDRQSCGVRRGQHKTVYHWIANRKSGVRAGRLLIRVLNLVEMRYRCLVVGGWWRTYHNEEADAITRLPEEEVKKMIRDRGWTLVDLKDAITTRRWRIPSDSGLVSRRRRGSVRADETTGTTSSSSSSQTSWQPGEPRHQGVDFAGAIGQGLRVLWCGGRERQAGKGRGGNNRTGPQRACGAQVLAVFA